MDQIRATFLVFLTIAAVGAGSAAYMSSRKLATPASSPAQTPIAPAQNGVVLTIPPTQSAPAGAPVGAPTRAPDTLVDTAPAPQDAAVAAASTPTGDARRSLPKPIFAPDARLADVLPVVVCGASNTGGHLTLLHIQAAGLDVAHGFHLGIVPFNLNPDYRASEADRASWLKSGALDCAMTTLDAVAVHNPGIITALVGESTAAQQLWASQAQTIDGLTDQRVAYESGGASEAFVRALPVPVVAMPVSTLDEAVRAFNAGEADAVAGWEPAILDAENGGGRAVPNTSSIYPVVSVIAVSRSSAQARPDVIAQFHAAWFDALQQQSLDMAGAAEMVAAWGNNAWSGISATDAADDWQAQQRDVDAAGLARNTMLMAQPDLLLARLNAARQLWPGASRTQTLDAVDGRFVQAAAHAVLTDAPVAEEASVTTEEDTLPDAAVDIGDGAGANDAIVDSNPPCPRIAFAVELGDADIARADALTPEARRVLNLCAVSPLRQSPGALLRITGASAWPGPSGAYTREQVLASARRRAEAVVDYLVKQGIERRRLMIVAALPPVENRETDDLAVQAQDRFVEIVLMAPAP